MNTVRHYMVVSAALMLLLAVTVALAYVDLGPMNTAAAMLVSLAKGTLILVFFMHLGKATGLIRLAALAGFLWLALLLTLALSDYLTR